MAWNLAVNPTSRSRFSAAGYRTTQITGLDPDMIMVTEKTGTSGTEIITTGIITDLPSQNHVTQDIRLVTQHVTIDTVIQDILLGQQVTQDILVSHSATKDIVLSQHVTQDIPVVQNVTIDILMSQCVTQDIQVSRPVILDILIQGMIRGMN